MLWSEILSNWLNGIILEYPKQLTEKFMWNTSVLKNNGNVEFLQNFKINNLLPFDTTLCTLNIS